MPKKTICRFFTTAYRFLIAVVTVQLYFWNRIIKNVMKNKDHFLERHKEHHPQVSIGLFLIVLGLALLVATNDLLGLGSVKDYFTWETVLVFIGALLLLNLQFIHTSALKR